MSGLMTPICVTSVRLVRLWRLESRLVTRRIMLFTLVLQSWALFCQSMSSKSQVPTSGFKVGLAFRRFEPREPYNWRGAKTHALLTTVWYPATRSAVEHPTEVPGLSIFKLGEAAQDADFAASPSKFPLVVISHGTGGSGLSMAWLGTELASHGYVVAAVNHPGNNGAEAYTAEGFSTWWERARDLSVVIDSMLSDGKFGNRLDAQRNHPRSISHWRQSAHWRPLVPPRSLLES